MEKNINAALNIEPTTGEGNSILANVFSELIDERLNITISSKTKKNKEYRAIVEREAEILKQLEATLVTDEQKKLLDDLEGIGCQIDKLSQEFAYRQGLQDASTITKEFNEFISGGNSQ